MDLQEIWSWVCKDLKEEISEIAYRTFIETSLIPVRLEGDTIYIKNVMYNMNQVIEQNYMTIIERCLFRVCGRKIRVCLVKDDNLSAINPLDVVQTVRLDPKYTFESFVVGSGNRFAHAAALAVAQNPAEIYNPLFIYGGVGLGKTHLMHAIGDYIHEHHPEKKLLYVNCETFMNDLISAIQQGNNVAFRNLYRNTDVLMIDDIQFIGGKDATQEEFFNTFNTLYTAGKQIVMTSDRPPKSIAHLEERLTSRFTWGLTVDIQRPDLETRIAILRSRVDKNTRIDDSVLELIATNVDSNIRELEGSLNCVIAYSRLVKEPITESLCRAALKEVLDKHANKTITADSVIQAVAGYYSLTYEDLIGPSRKREIAVPRQIAIYLTRELTGMSLPQIGLAFGDRDHTTVLHSIEKITSEVKGGNPKLAIHMNDLRHLIQT